MSLYKLDQLINKIASLVHEASPIPDWTRVCYVAKLPPDLQTSINQFFFKREDASVVADATKVDIQLRSKLTQLLIEHRKVTEELGQPWWYQIEVCVDRDGSFRTRFEYTETFDERRFMFDRIDVPKAMEE
ncbi:MAG TPA: DUF600 family protein [Thermogutta sp.]|nr:DUF600 family protein [Thermogutta sp.]